MSLFWEQAECRPPPALAPSNLACPRFRALGDVSDAPGGHFLGGLWWWGGDSTGAGFARHWTQEALHSREPVT